MAFLTKYVANILAGLSLIFLVSVTSTAQGNKPSPLAEHPIDIINNRIVVNVPVGESNLSMVLDTGATATALFQSRDGEYTDLRTTGSSDIIFPALDAVVVGANIDPVSISVGAEIFTPEKMLLIDRKSGVGDRLNFKFNGLLGQDFFNEYVVEIDPKNGVLRLYPTDTDLSEHFKHTLKLFMKGTAPHVQFHSKLPWESIALSKELLLDTGYPGAMVIWESQHFRKAARGEDIQRLRENNTGIFTYANFRIGKLKFMRTPIFVSPNEPVQAQERDGLIGANVLLQFHHVIDFPKKRLQLAIRNIHVNHIDGELYLPNNEQFIVKNFLETPASMFVLKYQ